MPFFSAADFDDGSGNGVPDGGVTVSDLLAFLTLNSGGIVSTLDGVRFAYRGYQYDPHLNLYHVRNRVLDPELGRWLQRDPAGFVDGLNLYAYCGSNPFGRWDPYGLNWIDDVVDYFSYTPDGVAELYDLVTGKRAADDAKHEQLIQKTIQQQAAHMHEQFCSGKLSEQRAQQFWLYVRQQLGDLNSIYQNRRYEWRSTIKTGVGIILVPLLPVIAPAAGAGYGVWAAWGALTGFAGDAIAQDIAIALGFQDSYDWQEGGIAAATGGLFGIIGRAASPVVGRLKGWWASRGGAAAEEAAAGTSARSPVGRSGEPQGNVPYQKVRNSPGSVGNRDYTGHAFDQMQNRGITPSVVENTIQHGTAMPGKYPGSTVHYDPVNNISVVTDTASGRVITVSPGQFRGGN